MFWIRIFSFLLVIPFISVAQQKVEGLVLDEFGQPIPYANVQIEGANEGAACDEIGKFSFETKALGKQKVKVSSLGFKTVYYDIFLTENQRTQLGELKLSTDMLGLNEVVVTGTMREAFVADSPVKIDVISVQRLTANVPATNLMQGLKLMNGVQEVVACVVCNTNSISINGLPGAYTAVLMDGSPIYGNLASVYGLNGIPTQMIDRIEVIKGPNSTLYGSEAIAGVINIITKKPEDQPLLASDAMLTSHSESYLNFAFSKNWKNWSQSTGINTAYQNRIDDGNGDGFSDQVSMDRISILSKWSMKRPNYKRFTIATKLYYEDRRNGVEAYLQQRAYKHLRGSDSIYGESIYTKRAELFGTYELQTHQNIRIDYSLSAHLQDSYYGSSFYEAKQNIAFANLIYTKPWKRQTLMAGFTNRYQFYDDNTVATDVLFGALPLRQYLPGIFIENEWKYKARVTAITGVRLDYYGTHGFIPAPRLRMKYSISEWKSVRGNFGTGFKVVNLFTEDHAFITGQREVIVSEALNPERSWNISGNFHHVYVLGKSQGSIDVDAFYTNLFNIIKPNYSQPGKIIYSNSNGGAQTHGIALNFNQQFEFPLAYSVGLNYNKATISQNGEVARNIEFAPQFSSVITVNYSLRKWKLDIAYNTQITGPMALPEVYDLDEFGSPLSESRPIVSKPFSMHNIQLTKRFKNKNIQCYGGMQNFSNFRQSISPLSGSNDPNFPIGFSPCFDTGYAYSSIHGREVFVGVRYNLK